MKNDEMPKDIFEYLIDNDNIKTKKLNEMGYSSRKITKLVNSDILMRTEKRGIYQLAGVSNLYLYGKHYLIPNKDYVRATQCFNRCYKNNSNHAATCFQLFFRAVKEKKYDEAFKYLDGFYKGENEYYNTDSRVYLFLLSQLSHLPDRYKEELKTINYNNMKLIADDNRFRNVDIENKMRLSIINKRFDLAHEYMNILLYNSGGIEVQNLVIKNLLKQVEKEPPKKNNKKKDQLRKTDSTYVSETQFVRNKAIEVMENKDVCVFYLANEERKKAIFQILNEMPDLEAFCVGEEPYLRVVLRYRERTLSNVYHDYKQIQNIYEVHYNIGDYDRCIEEVKYFMSILDNPRPYMFYRLGLCYYKKQDANKALDFISVASEMNRDAGIYDHDLSRFIKQLAEIVRAQRNNTIKDAAYIDSQNNEQTTNGITKTIKNTK